MTASGVAACSCSARLLLTSAFASPAGVPAFDGDDGVCASDQENPSYECEVAAINKELGCGGGKGGGRSIKNCSSC